MTLKTVGLSARLPLLPTFEQPPRCFGRCKRLILSRQKQWSEHNYLHIKKRTSWLRLLAAAHDNGRYLKSQTSNPDHSHER